MFSVYRRASATDSWMTCFVERSAKQLAELWVGKVWTVGLHARKGTTNVGCSRSTVYSFFFFFFFFFSAFLLLVFLAFFALALAAAAASMTERRSWGGSNGVSAGVPK